jgi:hypothetical protein
MSMHAMFCELEQLLSIQRSSISSTYGIMDQLPFAGTIAVCSLHGSNFL